MDNDAKGKLGVEYVAKLLELDGYTVIPRPKGEVGYDLLAIKDGRSIKIEIKTTQNLDGGIPDMHNTEFYQKDNLWYLVADELRIVRIDKNFNPIQLDTLTREEVDAYAKSHKTIVRVRTTKLDRDLSKGTVGTRQKL